MEIVTFFNHKGGVAKTTNCYNLAWKLAEKGKKVVLVDADSQCNLTGLAMGLLSPDDKFTDDSGEEISGVEAERINKRVDEAEQRSADFWERIGEQNLHDALAPAFNSEPRPLEAVELFDVPGVEGLYLLPGSIELAKYESDLALAQAVRGSLGSQKNIPGAINRVLKLTAEKAEADYMLVDLSPSLGAINQNFVSISDKIIIPCAPDYFSLMALNSLTKVFIDWKKDAIAISGTKEIQNATYPFPEPKFKVLGTVISRFGIYKGKPASAYARWIDRVENVCKNELHPALKKEGLVAKSVEDNSDKFILAKVRDFNSLRPKSQELQKPAYALTDEEIGLNGRALDNTKVVRDEIDEAFGSLADEVIL